MIYRRASSAILIVSGPPNAMMNPSVQAPNVAGTNDADFAAKDYFVQGGKVPLAPFAYVE